MARIVPTMVQKTTPEAKLKGVIAWAWLAPGSPMKVTVVVQLAPKRV